MKSYILPLLCCCKIKPACIHVQCISAWVYWQGTVVSASFIVMNAYCGHQSILVLMSGQSGICNVAIMLTLKKSWLASQNNELKSMQLVGFRNCIFCICDGMLNLISLLRQPKTWTWFQSLWRCCSVGLGLFASQHGVVGTLWHRSCGLNSAIMYDDVIYCSMLSKRIYQGFYHAMIVMFWDRIYSAKKV